MPSVDEVTRMAKDNLRHSLMTAHNLTLKSSDHSDFVLHRMNEVLRAVTDSCFDSSSMDAVGALYGAIGEVQHLVANTHELALVNFSRSFAVVLEEAIKMKVKQNGSAGNNNNNNTIVTSGGPWGNTAKSSGIDARPPSTFAHRRPVNSRSQSVDVRGKTAASPAAGALPQGQDLNGKPAAHNNSNNTSATSGGPWGNTAKRSGIDARPPSTFTPGRPRRSQSVDVRGKTAAPPAAALHRGQGLNCKPAPSAAPISAAEIAHRKEKEQKKDYSPEAIKGRIRIHNIPTAVTELQLRGHFEQIGEILSLSYPIAQGIRKGFAFLKFKDNETADEVCGHLNGTKLGGTALLVERAKYWFRKDPAPAFGTGRANVSSGPGSGSGSGLRLASASSKIDADEVD